MRLRSFYTIFLATALIAACSQDERAFVVSSEEDGPEEAIGNIEPGMLNILVSDDIAARIDAGEDPATLFESLDPTAVMRLFPYDSIFEKRQRDAGLHKWYTVFFNKAKSVTKTGGIASAIPGIIEVEQVLSAESEALVFPFNDPYATTRQWHLLNDGTMLSGFRNGADINVVPVWKEFTAGSKDVIVGVIDSGIQYDHPDLQGVILPPGENGSKSFFVSNILSPYSYSTIDNHGTHVAGIIAAINNNGTGVSGIAGGNDGTGGVRILDCQAIGQSSMIAQAIQWAANHGAVIINNSWNLSYDNESDVPDETPSSYKTAINYFIDNAGIGPDGKQTGPMKGGLVLFSAGNNSWTKSQPSMYDKVIAVGATGPAGEAATYTNYGDWVDICAPGGNHASPYANEIAQIYSTKAGGTYGALQGTSMACPVVTGVAALLVSYFGGPGFTCDALKEMLLEGGNRELSSKHNRAIGPVLDAYASFTEKGKTLSPVSTIFTVVEKRSIQASVSVQAYGDDPVFSYLLALSTDKGLLTDLDPFNVPGDVTTLTVNTSGYKVGGRASVEFRNLSPGKYHLTAVAFSRTHRYSRDNVVLELEVYGNRAPVITPSSIQPISLNHNQNCEFIVEYSDPEGDKMSIELERGSTAAKWTRNSSNSLLFSIDGSAADPGAYTASLTVTDSEKASTSLVVEYFIETDIPPTISTDYAEPLELTHNDSVSIGFSYSDPDDTELEIVTDAGSPAASWSEDSEGHLRLQIDGNAAPAGTYTAILTVTDPPGQKAEERVVYTILANSNPVITASEESGLIVTYDQNANIDFLITDQENDTLTVSTDAGSSNAQWTELSVGHYRLSISGKTQEEGRHDATISASDNYGGSSSFLFSYYLAGNKQPVVTGVPADLVLKAGEKKQFDPGQFFSDADGDPLAFTVSSDSGFLKTSISGNTLILEAGNSPEIVTVRLSASDGKSDPVSCSFRVRTCIDSFADVYPGRVSDKLTIISVTQGTAQIKIISSTGKTIISKNVTLSPFEPYVIDMSNCAPGVYTVSLSAGGKSSAYKIVKI